MKPECSQILWQITRNHSLSKIDKLKQNLHSLCFLCLMKNKLKASFFTSVVKTLFWIPQSADNAHNFYLVLKFCIFIPDLPFSKVFVHIAKKIEMYLYKLWNVFVQICFAFSSSTSSREKLQALYQRSFSQRIVWQIKKSHRYPAHASMALT